MSKPEEMMPVPVAVSNDVSLGRVAERGGAEVLQFAAMALGDGSPAHRPPELKAA
ncbi:MAG: hypothetical protein LAO76_23360 [Acidobacteriia bacterium]|nr:hypothetical protein [Terriglobia bacterium]